jgi:hypothetical protein
MYRLRNALTNVVTKHGSNSAAGDNLLNRRDDEHIFVRVGVGVSDNSNNNNKSDPRLQREQQPLYSIFSSEASEEISAPSILFQSTEDSDSSSIQTSPSLSVLYHNPYEPMSFVKRSIQQNSPDTLTMIPAKSDYTGSNNGESTNETRGLSAVNAYTNHPSSAYVQQVPESVITSTRPIDPSTLSTGTSTTASITSTSFSSSSVTAAADLTSPPHISRDWLPTLPSPPETDSSFRKEEEGSTCRKVQELDRRNSPPETSPDEKSCGSPWRINDESEQREDIPEMSPIKQERGSPWRIKSEPTEHQDFPVNSPSRNSPGSPWRIETVQKEEDHLVYEKVSVVTPTLQEGYEKTVFPSPPKQSNSAAAQALASMARLQELEQKKHALRRQRFRLEQRLYQFCVARELTEEKVKEEPELAQPEVKKFAPKRFVRTIKRPWRAPRHQKKQKETIKRDQHDIGSQKEKLAPNLEGKTVLDWEYTTGIPATDKITSGEHKMNKKKALKVLYSGRLNGQGQPHGDDATIKYLDGQIYRGSVRNGLRSGIGHNKWPDGQEYKGEWLENSRNGRGTHSWADGKTVTGDWKDGHLHGKIFFVWPNGATFDGRAKMGKRDGRGTT